MPFINTKTTVSVSAEKELVLKEKLGQAIKLLGKGETWLMLNFEDNKRMWFKGENKNDLAMIEISLFGKATDSQYDAMTGMVCNIISKELGISSDCIYVKYEEIDHWGYNGFNF